jgi:BirA family transcriptional regulator, biotin operon repressor / biotin---[acetyl-CoA-carboxylase] ligase
VNTDWPGPDETPAGGVSPALAPGKEAAWLTSAIADAVAPQLPAFTVEVATEIDSSNSELMRRARGGRMAPVLLVAERQTAGRGRLGRDWLSDPGASLTFSLGMPLAPGDWSGLSLAVGVSVAESLHPLIQLKWPNDLWFSDRKLGGVLIETGSAGEADAMRRYAVIGIGINITRRAAAGLAVPPAALEELLPGLRPAEALLRIAAPLVQTVQVFETFGFAPFQARFSARDALRDRAVVLSDGSSGTAHGITEAGALLVHTAGGMKTLISSEVSVRPVA